MSLYPTPPSPLPLPSGYANPAGGLLGRLLTHPGPTTAGWARALRLLLGAAGQHLAALAGHAGPYLLTAAVLLALFALLAGARRLVRRRRGGGPAGRYVQLRPGTEVDPHGATVFWTLLHELLHSQWKRTLTGQPHLAFELLRAGGQLHLGVWLPPGVPVELVHRAAQAAWPGIELAPGPPPVLAPAGALTLAGRMRLRRPEHFPLAAVHPRDPLRPLLAATADLGAGQSAVVQILARPVTGRRTGRGLAAARGRRTGKPAGLLPRLLNLLPTPGRPTPSQAGGPGALAADLLRDSDTAAILAKAVQPGWAVHIRYALLTPPPPRPGTDRSAPWGWWQARRRVRTALRPAAHALTAGFALHTAQNRLVRRRLPHPARRLNRRTWTGGQWLSVAELAGLAHLPLDPVVAGLTRAAARTLPPPPALLTGPASPASPTGPGEQDR